MCLHGGLYHSKHYTVRAWVKTDITLRLQDGRLGGIYDVEEIEVIPTDLEWVIHYRNRNRYHRSDPEAVVRGRPSRSVEKKPREPIRNSDGWKIYTRTSGPLRHVFGTSLKANDGVEDEMKRGYTPDAYSILD